MTISSISISDIVSQTLILFFLIGLGYLFAKSKYLPPATGEVLAKMVVKVAMPATILIKMLGADFSRDDYINGVYLYFFSIIFILLAYLLAFLSSKVLKLPDETASIYRFQAMFGNVAFFALPLYLVLFGEMGVIYALFFNMGNDTILWTLGIFIINRHKESSFKKNLKHMLNANTIAFIVGIILMVTKLNKFLVSFAYFQSFYKTISYVADITTALSMLFIGFILASIKLNLRDLKSKIPVMTLSLQKLIIIPMISILALYFLWKFKVVNESVVLIGVLQLAMPIGSSTASIAMEYEGDYKFATEAVFVSTIISILTLPLVSSLLSLVFS